ncbi:MULTISPECIES: amidohydrolase family protein [Prauserella salsuginis group]|uniref:Imidazolonepropionase-like amidohydrolase n=2 Tax=Prauserella salsuginis group TaxID=2893672 RepID=A0A839XG30_9PSEU|nr:MULTISPECIES: amidohydrolase family protein [Prauserella salsuginis group]MBB3661407.1 imidazolonepropionase-like amidohydrolase [Prauserella sediminis]MCR3719328.1 Imidazolonepropionase [Prauserella flava]MCR3735658.1 Imidazolonepropionase [Prauserella salsuginis]
MFHIRGVVLPDGRQQDLWIDGDRISLTPVEGARTLDGAFVLPGLVDAHCHPGIGVDGPVTLDEAAAQAETDRDAGTLLIRDCGVPIDTRPLQRRDDLPRIIRSGKHISLPKRYIPNLGLDLEHPEQLPDAVTEQALAGDGWVKLVGDWIDRSVGDLAPLWPDDVLADAVKAAHDAGARVTAHVFGEAALPGLIDAGIDCLEHGTGLDRELLDRMAAQGTALVPTLINIENFPGIADQAGKYPTYAAHMRALHAGVGDMIGEAIDAGVDIYAGTDAGGMVAHGKLPDEVSALHRAGMPAEQALGAASWAARAWLGYDGIADGRPADLVVFDADPRDDLDVLRSPRHILLRGRLVG